MHVVATAGHVDHGKSTLVRALTGTDPDRLEEERRRGLTITLGYAWTTLPGDTAPTAFVDVPGHERFIATMLAGVGPVPAVLLVVAADDPWMPQAEEHLRALELLGVPHGVVAVTRADLADPDRAAERARRRLAGGPLAEAPIVAVSAASGRGLDDLRAQLSHLTATLPAPAPDSDVRLWVDRVFSVRGAGTVVTGTLPAGTVRVGDRLDTGGGTVRVRSMQALGHDVSQASGVARVALRLGAHPGVPVARGTALVSAGAWWRTSTVDVRLDGDGEPPQRAVLHVGAAGVGCRLRPLSLDMARVTTDALLPLRVGDRGLLRDPGSRRLWGVRVLDPAPPDLRRRGAAAARSADLRAGVGEVSAEVTRRGPVRVDTLRRIGIDSAAGTSAGIDTEAGVAAVVRCGDWLVAGDLVADLRHRVSRLVDQHEEAHPLEPGPTTTDLARSLGLPDVALLAAVLPESYQLRAGRVVRRDSGHLPQSVEHACAELAAELAAAPFASPGADRLAALGLDRRAVAAAHRAGRLLRLDDAVVLLPGADEAALDVLIGLPQPFTASQARQALGTSRRVVLPLLDLLDRRGLTVRLPDDRRTVIAGS